MDLDKIPESPSAREARVALEKVLDRAEARAEIRGEARALLTLLEARGLSVSDEQRARVLACADLEALERWIRRAATASTTDQALD